MGRVDFINSEVERLKQSGKLREEIQAELCGKVPKGCKYIQEITKDIPSVQEVKKNTLQTITLQTITWLKACGTSSAWTIHAKEVPVGQEPSNFAVTTCDSNGPKVPFDRELSENCISDLPTPRLGGGYSEDRQMAAWGDCFKGTVTYVGGTESVTSLESAQSFEDIQSSLTAEVKGKAKVKLVSGDIGAKYLRNIKDNYYTRSFYYVQKITLPSAVFQPAGYKEKALNEYGLDAYKEGAQQFRQVCGDRLVGEIHQGASLYVTFRINFSSHSDKENFEAHMNADYGGLASIKASVKATASQYKVSGQVEFSAFQSGGDATRLAKIFGKCEKHYCIAKCSLDNLDACDGVIDGVIKYAQDDLPDQINFKDGKVLGGAAPLAYIMPKVADVTGLDVGQSVIGASIVKARKSLWEAYSKQIDVSDVVKHALDFPTAYHFDSDATLTQLKKISEVLKSNVEVLESGVWSCYLEPTECDSTQKKVMGELIEVDLNIS